MPSVRSLVFKCLACRFKLVAVIFLLSEIMPFCSRYAEKGLVYITITALSSRQLFFCSEYTKLNMHLSCNIYSMSDAKCIYLIIHLYIL
jgi:hypothetical protein